MPIPTGPRSLSVHIDGPLEAALVQGAGTDTAGPALTQVVKRVLVW